jgi:hypothetical protein
VPCCVSNDKTPCYVLPNLHGKEKEIRLVAKKNPYRILVEKPSEDRLEYVGVDGRIILKWVLQK